MKGLGCKIPQQGYDDHGDPVQSDDITFTLHNSKGEPVTSWDAGEVYHLTTALDDELTQALVVADAGTLNVTDPGEARYKVGFQTEACENAWASLRKREGHTMRWDPPAEVPEAGLCVEFSTAHAFSGRASYQVNTVRTPALPT
jgi:hypothetical protein